MLQETQSNELSETQQASVDFIKQLPDIATQFLQNIPEKNTLYTDLKQDIADLATFADGVENTTTRRFSFFRRKGTENDLLEGWEDRGVKITVEDRSWEKVDEELVINIFGGEPRPGVTKEELRENASLKHGMTRTTRGQHMSDILASLTDQPTYIEIELNRKNIPNADNSYSAFDSEKEPEYYNLFGISITLDDNGNANLVVYEIETIEEQKEEDEKDGERKEDEKEYEDKRIVIGAVELDRKQGKLLKQKVKSIYQNFMKLRDEK